MKHFIEFFKRERFAIQALIIIIIGWSILFLAMISWANAMTDSTIPHPYDIENKSYVSPEKLFELQAGGKRISLLFSYKQNDGTIININESITTCGTITLPTYRNMKIIAVLVDGKPAEAPPPKPTPTPVSTPRPAINLIQTTPTIFQGLISTAPDKTNRTYGYRLGWDGTLGWLLDRPTTRTATIEFAFWYDKTADIASLDGHLISARHGFNNVETTTMSLSPSTDPLIFKSKVGPNALWVGKIIVQ